MANQYKERMALLLAFGETPSVSDALSLCDPTEIEPELAKTECNAVGDGGFPSKVVVFDPDGTTGKGGVTMKLQTPNAKGELPRINDLLKTCGLDVDVDSDNGIVTYFPRDNDTGTRGTLIQYIDGEKRLFDGVVGNMKVEFTIGEPVKFTTDLSGFTEIEPIAEDTPSGIVLDGNPMFVVSSLSVSSLGGSAIRLKSVELDLGVDVKKQNFVGEKEFTALNPQPTLTIEDKKNRGDVAPWSDLKNSVDKNFEIELVASNGQKLKLVSPVCKYNDLSSGDSDGVGTFKRVFDLHPDPTTFQTL